MDWIGFRGECPRVVMLLRFRGVVFYFCSVHFTIYGF